MRTAAAPVARPGRTRVVLRARGRRRRTSSARCSPSGEDPERCRRRRDRWRASSSRAPRRKTRRRSPTRVPRRSPPAEQPRHRSRCAGTPAAASGCSAPTRCGRRRTTPEAERSGRRRASPWSRRYCSSCSTTSTPRGGRAAAAGSDTRTSRARPDPSRTDLPPPGRRSPGMRGAPLSGPRPSAPRHTAGARASRSRTPSSVPRWGATAADEARRAPEPCTSSRSARARSRRRPRSPWRPPHASTPPG